MAGVRTGWSSRGLLLRAVWLPAAVAVCICACAAAKHGPSEHRLSGERQVQAPDDRVPEQEPGGDPSECLDPLSPGERHRAEWEAELAERLDGLLPELADCPGGTDAEREARVSICLEYDQDGAPLSQTILRSGPSDCAFAECAKQRLAGLQAPGGDRPMATYWANLAFTAGQAPRLEPHPPPISVDDDDETEAPACVEETPWAKRGHMGPETIQAHVRESYGRLRLCYEQALVRNPRAEGQVAFHFVIDTTGKATDVRIQFNTLPDCEAVRCMRWVFRSLAFPSPGTQGPVTVVYPIRFAR